jgi:diacylglycerol kinase
MGSPADSCGNLAPMPNRPFSAAFADAADGIVHALLHQPNFCIQLAIALVAVAGAALLHFDTHSWLLIIVVIGFVLAAELFNTCLEHVVDLIQPETHPLARSAKHAGAAAVLVASIVAAVVGAIVYGQALAHLFRQRG